MGNPNEEQKISIWSTYSMQAIILCGGLSTRLGSITKEIPKILLPIGDRVIIDYQIDLLKTASVTEIVLASGHLHNVIFDRIGHQYEGLKVLYAREYERLGTGGAIRNAMNYIESEPFFALNGDILTEGVNLCTMLEYHCHIKNNVNEKIDGTLLSTFVDDISDFGEIISDENGKIISFKEKRKIIKSGYINGGIYTFNKSVCNYFPNQDTFSLEFDVFPNINKLYSFQTQANLIDIGMPDRLEYARKIYLPKC